MSKPLDKMAKRGILVPAVEEVPRISDAERAKLRASLEKARSDIAAGRYDVVTPETLRAEFDAVYYDGKSDTEIDVKPSKNRARSTGKT